MRSTSNKLIELAKTAEAFNDFKPSRVARSPAEKPELPKDIGGYQAIADDEIIMDWDIFVEAGSPVAWANHAIGLPAKAMRQTSPSWNVYRKMPVMNQASMHAACDAGLTAHPATGGDLPEPPRPTPPPHKSRKDYPLATGVLDYFPDALMAVAECSKKGNDQHHPGTPLHWDRSKSTDHPDALMRHLIQRGRMDTDGVRHSAKVAWRALAMLQEEIERDNAKQLQ